MIDPTGVFGKGCKNLLSTEGFKRLVRFLQDDSSPENFHLFNSAVLPRFATDYRARSQFRLGSNDPEPDDVLEFVVFHGKTHMTRRQLHHANALSIITEVADRSTKTKFAESVSHNTSLSQAQAGLFLVELIPTGAAAIIPRLPGQSGVDQLADSTMTRCAQDPVVHTHIYVHNGGHYNAAGVNHHHGVDRESVKEEVESQIGARAEGVQNQLDQLDTEQKRLGKEQANLHQRTEVLTEEVGVLKTAKKPSKPVDWDYPDGRNYGSKEGSPEQSGKKPAAKEDTASNLQDTEDRSDPLASGRFPSVDFPTQRSLHYHDSGDGGSDTEGEIG